MNVHESKKTLFEKVLMCLNFRPSKKTPLEEALCRLEVPEHGEDLAARCLATIPAMESFPKTEYRTLPRTTLKRLGLVVTVIASVGFWTTQPMWNGSKATRPESTAFAETLQAMRRVDHYHMTLRETTNHEVNKHLWRLPQEPLLVTGQEWFDIRRGLRQEAQRQPYRLLVLPDDTILKIQRPTAPDGRRKEVVERRNEKGRWSRARQEAQKTLTQSIENQMVTSHLVHSERGIWKGRAVTFRTYVQGGPKIASIDARYSVFVMDDASARVLLERRVMEKDGVQRTLVEWEWDYTPLENPSLFNPSLFKAISGTTVPRQTP